MHLTVVNVNADVTCKRTCKRTFAHLLVDTLEDFRHGAACQLRSLGQLADQIVLDR